MLYVYMPSSEGLKVHRRWVVVNNVPSVHNALYALLIFNACGCRQCIEARMHNSRPLGSDYFGAFASHYDVFSMYFAFDIQWMHTYTHTHTHRNPGYPWMTRLLQQQCMTGLEKLHGCTHLFTLNNIIIIIFSVMSAVATLEMCVYVIWTISLG